MIFFQRTTAVFLASWILASSGAQAQECVSSNQDVQSLVQLADEAYSNRNVQGVQDGVSAIKTSLDCLSEAIATHGAADLYEVLAKDAFLRRMSNEAVGFFRALQEVRPGYSPDFADTRHPLVRLFNEAQQVALGEANILSPPAGTQFWIDGRKSITRPSHRPAIFQLLTGEGTVLWTRILMAGEALPDLSHLAPKGEIAFVDLPSNAVVSIVSETNAEVLFTSPQEGQEIDETTGVALLKRHQQAEMPSGAYRIKVEHIGLGSTEVDVALDPNGILELEIPYRTMSDLDRFVSGWSRWRESAAEKDQSVRRARQQASAGLGLAIIGASLSAVGGYFWQREQGELDAANVTYNEQLALGAQWAAQDTYSLMEGIQGTRNLSIGGTVAAASIAGAGLIWSSRSRAAASRIEENFSPWEPHQFYGSNESSEGEQ